MNHFSNGNMNNSSLQNTNKEDSRCPDFIFIDTLPSFITHWTYSLFPLIKSFPKIKTFKTMADNNSNDSQHSAWIERIYPGAALIKNSLLGRHADWFPLFLILPCLSATMLQSVFWIIPLIQQTYPI